MSDRSAEHQADPEPNPYETGSAAEPDPKDAGVSITLVHTVIYGLTFHLGFFAVEVLILNPVDGHLQFLFDPFLVAVTGLLMLGYRFLGPGWRTGFYTNAAAKHCATGVANTLVTVAVLFPAHAYLVGFLSSTVPSENVYKIAATVGFVAAFMITVVLARMLCARLNRQSFDDRGR